MKEKIRESTYWFVKNGGIKATIALILIIVFVSIFKRYNENVEIYDLTFLFSIVVLMLLEIVVSGISKYVLNFFEDSIKLDKNYERVAKRYNKGDLFKPSDEKDAIRFPVAEVINIAGYQLEIEDRPKDMFTLPNEVKDHYDELFNSHETSNVFNQLVVRVDNWNVDSDKKQFHIDTSRSTYYNSLVTNRALDYRFKNNLTLRDIFQYGPFIPPLKDSPLSNHLGFNLIVISSDNQVPFVKRASYVSIGKKEYGNSVEASMKAKYCLEDNGEFKPNNLGITEAISLEIKDELNLELDLKTDEDKKRFLDNSLIAAYRDMIEGGKPQLLLCVHVDVTKEEIEKHFYEKHKKLASWDKESKELKDGKHLDWVSLAEMQTADFTLEGIRCSSQFFKMDPSATVSVILVNKFLAKEELTRNIWHVNPLPDKSTT